MTENINLTVDLKLDANGRPSTKPEDVLNLTQQILMKGLLGMTNNGTSVPTDMKDVVSLVREINTAALTTRKLDQEEQGLMDSRQLVETFKKMEDHFSGKNTYNQSGTLVERNPYAELQAPVIDVNLAEIQQGEQSLNPDDFIPEN